MQNPNESTNRVQAHLPLEPVCATLERLLLFGGARAAILVNAHQELARAFTPTEPEAHLRSLAAGTIRYVSAGRLLNSDCIQMTIQNDRVMAYTVRDIGWLVVVSLKDSDPARLRAAVGSAIKLLERLAKP